MSGQTATIAHSKTFSRYRTRSPTALLAPSRQELSPRRFSARTARTQLILADWHVRQLTRENCLEAFRLIDEVLQRDPKNAMALADLAFNWHMGGVFGWTKEPLPEAAERAGDAARRAVAADDQDAVAQTTLGLYELFSSRHDDAIRRLRRAIEVDPNSSFARGYLGVAYSFGGEPDRSPVA